MANRKGNKRGGEVDPVTRAYWEGLRKVSAHPLFAALLQRARTVRSEGNLCPPGAWAVLTHDAQIHVHPTRRGEPDEWAYVIAHLLLHLGFDHLRLHQERLEDSPEERFAFHAAACCQVESFLAPLKVGRPPAEMLHDTDLPHQDIERLITRFREEGIPRAYQGLGTAGEQGIDILPVQASRWAVWGKTDWPAVFANGIRQAVSQAILVASGEIESLSDPRYTDSEAQRARRWFIDSYPLLGALAAHFTIVEDTLICQRNQISVAAVSEERREIYLNPAAGLTFDELKFVIAHEILHVGLRHADRCRGRDPYYWNAATDFAINEWLITLGIGSIPAFGGLHDPAFQMLSAESIYDHIVTDLRRFRKLATLRGYGLGDILDLGRDDWQEHRDAVDLDDFCRGALLRGLEYHLAQGRGFLPLGLIEEIRALAQPPIPWDVQLGRWFDRYFAIPEKRRTFARPSRRQSAVPEIPLARRVDFPKDESAQTFGVILDTSGSMSGTQIAIALGAIASFATAREVPAARVIFCDAAPYDAGYLSVDDIAQRVEIKGRGGTVLQPAVSLLESDAQFSHDAPLLIVTDGLCDVLTIPRSHAFLMSEGARLPFVPRGPVFRMPKPKENRQSRS